MTKATKLYINKKLLQAFKRNAKKSHSTISKLVNEALRLALQEDAIDLKAIKDRHKQKLVTLDNVLGWKRPSQ